MGLFCVLMPTNIYINPYLKDKEPNFAADMKNMEEDGKLVPMAFYKPSEILNIFRDILTAQNLKAKVVSLNGVYIKNPLANSLYKCAYDTLRDDDTDEEITLVISFKLREELKSGNVVTVFGTVDRQLTQKGFIQILLRVTRLELVKEQILSETEIKQIEFRKLKSQKGFKNIDSALEEKLFIGNRPSVALVFATTSITMADFDAGKNAASSHIDFTEHRVPFSNAMELSAYLKRLDLNHYDAIALIRGGGSGIESLDDLLVIETVINLQTPFICAVGHVDEKLFLKNIADKVASTPNGLGSYFSLMVENVIQKKNKSKAILVEQVRKQFIEQIDNEKKQNKQLQDRLTAITKSSEDSQKLHSVQTEAMQKQNKELQDNLTALNKSSESMKDEVKNFNKSISILQQTNTSLQNSLNKLNAQNTQSAKDLADAKAHAALLEQQLANSKKGCSGCLGMVIAFISVLSLTCFLIFV